MFKDTFKYYKSKCPPPTYEKVIDFDTIDKNAVIVHSPKKVKNSEKYRIRGLLPSDKWQIYELKNRPGLIFIRNPFTVRGQRYWIARCLQDYPQAPHVVNLNAKYFSKNIIDDWWHALQETNDEKEKCRLKNGMRWTTLGYHHDWDTKVYAEEKRHKFPDDLAKLNAYFAEVLGLGDYSAEAAIVNFYPLGTTLAGHTDHSEKNLAAPLFSISFGQTAIFMLGGKTKEEEASAMFLKSGDIVCMSKESRLCYHAVPRIVKTNIDWVNAPLNEIDTTKYSENEDSEEEHKNHKKQRLTSPSDNNEYNDSFRDSLWNEIQDSKQWKPFADYIIDCRINVNVRQVLEHGEQSLNL
ncbi:nucleic acid dioxygenase ALKBH1 [Contarinia nasturtii]|uniref:nucleic acid dioxygenase ALKBH1 n=1 Tax=Contarinia nasturtii TaxID=265458 RepID=UPI0012D4A6F0|nr:nucleic acid dioxygenase ALKBH1 [Contarinia nasturtii]